MDYPCGKSGDCSFSCFDYIVQTNTESQRCTYRQTWMNALLPRLLLA